MKLLDLRKAAIREQATIHFRLRNGMECVVSEPATARERYTSPKRWVRPLTVAGLLRMV